MNRLKYELMNCLCVLARSSSSLDCLPLASVGRKCLNSEPRLSSHSSCENRYIHGVDLAAKGLYLCVQCARKKSAG